MASVKLIKKILEIIDPDKLELYSIKKADRTKDQQEEIDDIEDEISEIIEAVEEHQGQTQRLLVVGQIQYDGSEEVYTVALGPFGARGTLDTPEKFKAAAQGSTAAHEKGGRLAWDTKTGRGRGRYMVVPLLRTPLDAWNFYRTDSSVDPDVIVENIEATIRGPELDQILPACTCGVRPSSGHQSVMGVPVTRKCFRHTER